VTLVRLTAIAAFLAAAGTALGSEHVDIRLVPGSSSVQPGTSLTVAVVMKMQPQWHTYWRNPGDVGRETRATWTLPAGFTAGAIEWPVPKVLRGANLVSYGYEGETALLAEIRPDASVPPGGTATLAVALKWLECIEEKCVPASGSLEIALPVKASAPEPDPIGGSIVAAARRRLPDDGAAWKPLAVSAGGRLALTFTPPRGLSSVVFVPAEKKTIEDAAPQSLVRTASGYSLELKRADETSSLKALEGVLLVDGDGGPQAVAVTAPVQAAAALPSGTPVTASSGAGGDPALGLLAALTFAFAGGLILNLMPCVLPVLSLKVLGFVRHAGDEGGRPWKHGLAYTVGVVGSFLALAGALLALRAGGEQIGWGFQLQSPRFVAALAALFFVIGLNLFGTFEVGASLTRAGGLTAGRSGLARSLFDGALATIVATPCTAPFMGSALGFALAQPAYVALLVFAALGFGMAVPYLVLSLAPALVRFVPKPGMWMEWFKQLMGFFMMATVVVLVWIFGRQTGIDAIAFLLGGLVVVGLGAWIYGRGALSVSPRARLARAFGVAVAVAGLAYTVSQGQPHTGEGITWQAFSPEAVASARAAGKPVFIDFTAAWCFSCQVNERVALTPARVTERFREHDVAAFKADWTLEDAQITQALAGYGRNSVPLYVLYPPGASEPRLLPQLLTPDIVLTALDESVGKSASAGY
jgi:thiol:disulfide interchange protein